MRQMFLAAAAACAMFAASGEVAHAAIVNFTYDFSGSKAYAPSGSGGMAFDIGDLRVTVTGFNYSVDSPKAVLSNEIGVDRKQGAQGGLGGCSDETVKNNGTKECGGEPNLDSGTAPELLKFTFTSIASGQLVDVSIGSIDFNITNQNETFDAFAGSDLTLVYDDKDVNHSGGGASVAGNVVVNLGPASMFAFGVDDCKDTIGSAACTPDNTDQVRIAKLSGSYGNVDIAAVPLPATALLLLGGIGGLGALRIRRKA